MQPHNAMTVSYIVLCGGAGAKGNLHFTNHGMNYIVPTEFKVGNAPRKILSIPKQFEP